MEHTDDGVGIAIALFDWVPQSEKDLEFTTGDRIVITRLREDKGWWRGYLESDEDKKIGSFPRNYVDVISRRSEEEEEEEEKEEDDSSAATASDGGNRTSKLNPSGLPWLPERDYEGAVPTVKKPSSSSAPSSSSSKTVQPLHELLLITQNCYTLLAFYEVLTITKADAVADAILALAHNYTEKKSRTALSMITRVLQHEVDRCLDHQSNSLFRGNTMPTKLIVRNAHLIAPKFLSQTLRHSLLSIIKEKSSYELDPGRCKPGENCRSNAKRVQRDVKAILNAMLKSVSRAPKSFRRTCQRLHDITNKRFPELALPITRGFLFLRFFCPAVITPHAFGVFTEKDTISPSQRRGLIFITKTLQTLANGRLFKEDYLLEMNPFVTEHLPLVEKIAKQYIDMDGHPCRVGDAPPPPPEERKIYAAVVHYHLKDNLDKISALMEERGQDKQLRRLKRTLEARESGKVVYAAGDFKGEGDRELTFKKGDRILLIDSPKEHKEWWRGVVAGKVGVFPKRFITTEPLPSSK